MNNLLQQVLEQVTFWRFLLAFLLVAILNTARKYYEIWAFLQVVKNKYGGKPYFRFPLGFTTRFNIDPDDSLKWDKQSLQENPKWRLYASHIGTRKIVSLIDPDLIKDFLSDQTRYCKTRFMEIFVEFVGKGLIFSNGKMWKKHRKLISETFRFEFITSQIPTVSRVAKDLFEKELTDAKGKQINVLDLYERITGELVFQIFFGSDLIGTEIEGVAPTTYLARLANLTFENILSPENVLLGSSGIKLRLFKRNRELFRVTNVFYKFIIRIIEQRKKKMSNAPSESSDNKDFLGILLEAQKQSQGTEDEFTDEEIIHEFITFFIGGMDTTGHLLTMATYFFYHSSSEVKEAVMREAESLAKNTDEITVEKLNKVETMTAFFKETLRKATPAPMIFARDALVEHYIGDVRIPKGTMIHCSFIGNNFSPAYYKDPERFNHNRWIPGHADFEANASKNPFIFTPFSAGPRNCIGQHLAMMEAKIIFSIFLTNFKFVIPEDYKMRMRLLFLYGPRDPLLIDVENRNACGPKDCYKCI